MSNNCPILTPVNLRNSLVNELGADGGPVEVGDSTEVTSMGGDPASSLASLLAVLPPICK